MGKIVNISGFPEWLPEQKIFEDRCIAAIKSVYESFGFVPIETPAVELISTLTAKGVVDKEIFGLHRLKGETEKSDLGLHFDLTVPFARYVAQHQNELVFPFKRHQLQKVWRGERPQKGRSREFYQFDIDIISQGDLPISADAEVITVLEKALRCLPTGDFTIHLNNRKLLLGFYQTLNISAEISQKVIIEVDKLSKIGVDGVCFELINTLHLSENVAKRIIEFSSASFTPNDFAGGISRFNIDNELFLEGQAELLSLIGLLDSSVRSVLKIDLSMARGLDYYTGTILETFVDGHRDFGSIASGGSYANLAAAYSRRSLPGVGVSIGLTRVMELIFFAGLKELSEKATTKLLITVFDENNRVRLNEIAKALRLNNLFAEVFLGSAKLGKQIDYADKKGIRFCLFLQANGELELRDLKTKNQVGVSDVSEIVKAISTTI